MILKLSKEEVQCIIVNHVKTLFTGDKKITCSANLSSYASEAAEVEIKEKEAENEAEKKTDVPF